MSTKLTVKEFDSIIGNSEFKNDASYKYLGKDNFSNLISFVREYENSDADTDALEFMRINYKRDIGDIVTLKNYVGMLEITGGLQIEVLPKITLGNGLDADDEQSKRIFLKMLRSMKDFEGKVFNDSKLNVDRMNLYEIFIHMYIQEVRQLLKVGLKSGYVGLEGNLYFFKGKLQVSNHIKQNAAHKERFYVSYEEFHPNRPENRIVKATLEKLQKLTTNFENSKLIKQMLIAFEMVESSKNYEKDFTSVVIDRSTKNYKLLMQWSKVFLLNKSFTTFSGGADSKALLFPMESVYESYVGRNIKKYFNYDWEVSLQDKGYFLFTEPRRQFALRPDIVMRNDERIIIMDTKWKRLFNNERKNYGISQSDMYQMYAYAKKYENEDITPEVWLLYPANEEMKSDQIIEFSDDDGVSVKVFFVELEQIEDSMDDLQKRIS